MNHREMLAEARRVLDVERRAIADASERMADELCAAAELILACEGKLVLTGMGKSGLVCQKIAATFASTGTPAIFLHPSEGLHGDLGVIGKHDVVIAASNSGETSELLAILPSIQRLKTAIIAITGRSDSRLAKLADVVLSAAVSEEGCPIGLAPMASTTVTLALGDALAAVVLKARGFEAEDFARLHPGGALGRRLLMRIRDVMHSGDALPAVTPEASLAEVVMEMSSKRLGATCVLENGKLAGIITDGDLRRGLVSGGDPYAKTARELMTKGPVTTSPDAVLGGVLNLMEDKKITQLIVCEGEAVVGMVNVHDLLT